MEYQDSLELVCEQCSKIFEKTDSVNRYSFCSFKCEAEFAEKNSDFYAVTAKGRFPRTGRIDGELFTFPDDPAEFIKEIGRYPIDLFTFLQHPTYHGVMYPQYTVEMDNLAIMPISTFDHWLTKQIDGKTRNKARLAAKRQVEVIEVPFGDEFLTGLCQIMNETPTRQGKKFPALRHDT